jgi:deoxyribose-phosphate aldolase
LLISEQKAGFTPKGSLSGDIMEKKDLAGYIDHTLLKAEATEDQIRVLCSEAKEYHFKSVCVNTTWTSFCAGLLEGTKIITCVVVGFPLGAMETQAKAFEAKRAVELGAQEIDMVINIGALKSGEFELVREDIAAVASAAGEMGVKVIIEACLLTDQEKVTACRLSKEAGAMSVKTSTGLSTHGATIEDVRLMRNTVGPDLGVKAAGGVRTLDDAMAMIDAGATRIGTSGGINILAGEIMTTDY